MAMQSPALIAFDRQILVAQATAGLIGVDEVGRGALAGPVVAAAAWVGRDFYQQAQFPEPVSWIDDSKRLTAEKRALCAVAIQQWAQAGGQVKVCIAEASVAEIAQWNILGATQLAMRRALDELSASLSLQAAWPGEALLVDGRPMKALARPHRGVVGGDRHSFAIAVASIAAKVYRDQLMVDLCGRYPRYGFGSHKGYGVIRHRSAVLEHGPCPEHRLLFLRKLHSAKKSTNDVP